MSLTDTNTLATNKQPNNTFFCQLFILLFFKLLTLISDLLVKPGCHYTTCWPLSHGWLAQQSTSNPCCDNHTCGVLILMLLDNSFSLQQMSLAFLIKPIKIYHACLNHFFFICRDAH